MTAAVKLAAAALSDVGKAREINEDAEYAGERVFAVADGLGGHRAGEVASRIAIEAIAELDHDMSGDPAGSLIEAVRNANREVFERAQHEADLRGMGTTITAVAIDGTRAHFAHVGDSRCYLFRDGAISQVTQDHTLVARMVAEGKLTQHQAETHPQRSILTRALGAGADVDVDTLELELYGGDRLLLCSDGLTATIPDEELREYATKRADLASICRALVDEANARGGPDNITVVMVGVEGPRHRPEPMAEAAPPKPEGRLATAPKPETARRRRVPVRLVVWASIVLVALVAGTIGVRSWLSRSWYVGVDGTTVAIFQGLPTDAIGDRLNNVKERTRITLDQVAPFYRPRLQEGIRVADLAAARALVARIPRSTATPAPTPSPSRSP